MRGVADQRAGHDDGHRRRRHRERAGSERDGPDAAVPGVNITKTSARDINITTRAPTGTLEDSTLVLLDGRSIYQDFFGFVMWDFIPVDPSQIKQIEVIRGPASAVWGANALTGVVNVISKTPREMAGTSVAIEFGQFDRTRRGRGLRRRRPLFDQRDACRGAKRTVRLKISAGLLAQEALLRPVGNVPGTMYAVPVISEPWHHAAAARRACRLRFRRPKRHRSSPAGSPALRGSFTRDWVRSTFRAARHSITGASRIT